MINTHTSKTCASEARNHLEPSPTPPRMAGATVRNAKPSDRKLMRQLIHQFPSNPYTPMVDTITDAKNTVKNEYLARAFRLFKRGTPPSTRFTPQAATKISRI